jgi:L-ascorbate metabolism protein UlaG (beta-lactamase superfamily)
VASSGRLAAVRRQRTLSIVRCTLIGHATLLVETREAVFLVDPVLGDPFEGGAVSSWPQRAVDTGALPAPDFVVISHRHPDHFDVPSLARLKRDATVLLPRDPLIAHVIEKLGFKKLQVLEPGRAVSWFDTQLWATRSEEPVREVGLVFSDASGAIFDQVDTAVSRDTAEQLRARFRLAAHLARFASQNFEFFESRHTDFPWREHAANLEIAAALGARLVVPGSAGFRFCGEHAWLNRFLFPISRSAFLADLRQISPELRGEAMDPGDVLEVESGEARILRQASPFVRCTARGEDELRFDPTAPVPPLSDPNPQGRSAHELSEQVRRIVAALAAWARDISRPLSVPWRYRQARAVYRLEAALPDGALCFTLDFSGDAPELREGGGSEATVVHRIAASMLCEWADRRRDFFSVRAWSRRFSTTRRVFGDASAVTVALAELPDLLMHWLLRESEGSEDAARRRLDQEIAAAMDRA